MTCAINSYEGQDIATVVIPGAFLQIRIPKEEKDVYMVLDWQVAELLPKILPLPEIIHHKRGQSIIHCKLNVALCGMLKRAILFWKKLSESLNMQGLELTIVNGVWPSSISMEGNALSCGMLMT